MPYYTPESKTEQAFVGLIEQLRGGELDGVQVLKRLDNVRQAPPMITVVCPGSRDDDETGEQLSDDTVVDVVLRVESNVKEATEHDRICGVLRDWLRYEDIVSRLNDVMDGQQFLARMWLRGETTHTTDGKRHISEVKGRLLMVVAREGAE